MEPGRIAGEMKGLVLRRYRLGGEFVVVCDSTVGIGQHGRGECTKEQV